MKPVHETPRAQAESRALHTREEVLFMLRWQRQRHLDLLEAESKKVGHNTCLAYRRARKFIMELKR